MILSRQRLQGVTAERYYFQPSPEGGQFIVIGEGTFANPASFLDEEGNAFDRWFIQTIEERSSVNMLELGGDTAGFLWRVGAVVR